MTDAPWHDTVVLPALLRHARNTYGRAMRRALDDAGFDDVPRNGLYIIGGLAQGAGGAPLGQLVRELRVSKQAAGQLIDTLVARGYLDRAVDPLDRRRLNVALTPRGRAAAVVQAEARQRIDDRLLARVGATDVERLRRGLAALIEIGEAEPDDREAQE
jgi:DNA-binding MarR family transcriptional regulator